MNAMIFAAGLGTRLRPLTDHCPKALVKVESKSLLEHNIINLKRAGFDHIVVNDNLEKAEKETYKLVKDFLG